MTTEEPTPAWERIDCGYFHPYGICPKCKRGHGWKLPTSWLPDSSMILPSMILPNSNPTKPTP